MMARVRITSFGSRGVVVLALLTMSTLLAVPPATAAQNAEVTFTKDVAPILQASCQTGSSFQ